MAVVRRRYQELMDPKVSQVLGMGEEDPEAWQEIRRGWYLGTDRFRDRLLEHAAQAVKGRRRRSYEQPLMQKHDQSSAKQLLRNGLEALGLEIEELRGLKQNDARKQGLAWLVKSRTAVGDDWIRRELSMGHRSNVSRAVAAYRNPTESTRKRTCAVLHACTDP